MADQNTPSQANPIKVAIVDQAGAFVSGSAVTIADNGNAVEGALADAAIVTDTTGTINGKIRGLVKWAFERMPASLGQKVMASSFPVVIASDQTAFPVTASAGTNLNTSALALSATQTDGTQKAIARGGVKGATTAADVTSTSQGVDHNALDVADGGGSLTVDAANLDVALSTRLKPADTLTGVTTVATVTSLTQMNGAAIAMGTGARSAGTQRVTVATDDVVPVTDNAGSLTVDAPVGTPAFVRLSDGAAAQIGQKAMTASLPVVLASDQASVPVASTLTAETTKVIGTARVIGNAGAVFDAATAAAVPANGLYVGGSDGTNLRGILTTSAANLTAATTLGAQLTAPGLATWSITHRPAAATKATASKGAGAAGVRHVCTGFSFMLATVGTAQAAAINLDVIDGATGGTTRLWSGAFGGIPVNSQVSIVIPNCMLIGTAATAMTIEFSAAGAAASFSFVNLQGFSVS